MIENIIDFIKNSSGGYENALVLSSILSLMVTLILVIVTSIYVRLTKNILNEAKKTSKDREIKEKEDKTLFYLERLDFENLTNIRIKKEKKQYFKIDLFNNISLLDTISTLYRADKLVKNLIYPKLAIYGYKFFLDFHSEIFNLLTIPGLYGNDFNYYENFLDLLDEIFDKEILKVKKYETADTFKLAKDSVNKIREKIRR